MPKRFLWLLFTGLAGGLLWAWVRQRRDEFNDATPQFTPPRPAVPPAAGTFAPANVDQITTGVPGMAAPVAAAEEAALDEVIGYCMRCRTKRPIQQAYEETTESGRRAARGTCPVCGAKMFTFLATGGDD
ncbi:MAG: DUF5679 domain-containing protein [Kouleothrix sp.]